jgi:pyrimidine oxygenase
MDVGVVLPIGDNGWLISSTSPQYMPSFEPNRKVALWSKQYGFELALSTTKPRGFGGPSQHRDHNLESFTPMAGWRPSSPASSSSPWSRC